MNCEYLNKSKFGKFSDKWNELWIPKFKKKKKNLVDSQISAVNGKYLNLKRKSIFGKFSDKWGES